MKKLINIALGLFIVATAFTACNDDDEPAITGFSINKEEVTVGADGGKETVVIVSEGEWMAKSNKPWVNISPANGYGNTECTVSIDSTMNNKVRNALITFQMRDLSSQTLEVNQAGYGKSIGVADKEMDIKATEVYSKRFIEIKVTTNVPFKAEITDAGGQSVKWMYVHDSKQFDVDLDRKYRPRTTKVRFDWEVNTNSEKRMAHIKFVPASADDSDAEIATVEVTQAAAPRITDDRAGDSLAILLIEENLNCMTKRDGTENMRNWEGVTLWERKDVKEVNMPEEAIGRVRSVEFLLFDTKDGLPYEMGKLKYLEKLIVFSNTNNSWKNFPSAENTRDPMEAVYNLEYLKSLTVSAYGLTNNAVSFEMAEKLGDQLEYLDLSVNNFTTIPANITSVNFPKLTSLNLAACRRWTLGDLTLKNDQVKYPDGIGLNFNTGESPALTNLLLWENLEYLNLSYNYIEGELPKFDDGSVESWSQGWGVDPATGQDSIQYAIDNNLPKILPNCRQLRLNLNYFTGTAPDWLIYHPRLLSWGPSILIFNQMENGKDSSGKVVHFDNDPGEDYNYYYEAFPGIGEKYKFKETIEDE